MRNFPSCFNSELINLKENQSINKSIGNGQQIMKDFNWILKQLRSARFNHFNFDGFNLKKNKAPKSTSGNQLKFYRRNLGRNVTEQKNSKRTVSVCCSKSIGAWLIQSDSGLI